MKFRTSHKYLPPALLLAALFCAVVPARANDASLDLSGSPRLMAGHPSVRMQSERIFLRVEKNRVQADCRFTFVNTGPACVVRMGFPDDSYERRASASTDAPFKSGFTSFQSYVDGRAVPTRTESAADSPTAGGDNTLWRVKMVAFGARGKRNSVRRVREVYTVPIGSELTFLSSLAGYTLHTGSSWKGPIGKSEVEVLFARPLGRRALRAFSMAELNPGDRAAYRGRHHRAHRRSAQGAGHRCVPGAGARASTWRAFAALGPHQLAALQKGRHRPAFQNAVRRAPARCVGGCITKS
jgi:hypothetical protein